MSLGHFLMAAPAELFFYPALAVICLGNGFFKPNISSIVGKLYKEGDNRRDAGFTIFYMGINVGAFLAPLVCGLIGETFGWHYGFGLAGVGMLLGLIVFVRGGKHLEGHGLPPNPALLQKPLFAGLKSIHGLYIGCILLVPVLALGLNRNATVGGILYTVGIVIALFLLYTAFTSDKVTRDRLLVVMVLMFFHTLFFAFF